MRIEQGKKLVGRRDAHVDEVVAGADQGAQRLRLAGERRCDPQPVRAQPQVLGDDLSVTSIALRAGEHLAVPPLLDRVWLDRDDRVPGLQQRVDKTAVRPFDANRHLRRIPEGTQPVVQLPEPVEAVRDREPSGDTAITAKHADRVMFGSPVHSHVVRDVGRQGERQRRSFAQMVARRRGAGCRVVATWRSWRVPL
jgi:hypothetical protein